jgi:Zn-dependent peptidase ImmA (M78 family)
VQPGWAWEWEDGLDSVRDDASRDLGRFVDPFEAPTDLRRIAAGMGITVVEVVVEPGDDPDFTGRSFETDGRFRLIVIREGLYLPRQRFTLAHELGHFARRDHAGRCGDLQERIANIYASELLAPTERLCWQMRQYGRSVPYLAGLNGVSIQMMNQRLNEIARTTVRRLGQRRAAARSLG